MESMIVDARQACFVALPLVFLFHGITVPSWCIIPDDDLVL